MGRLTQEETPHNKIEHKKVSHKTCSYNSGTGSEVSSPGPISVINQILII